MGLGGLGGIEDEVGGEFGAGGAGPASDLLDERAQEAEALGVGGGTGGGAWTAEGGEVGEGGGKFEVETEGMGGEAADDPGIAAGEADVGGKVVDAEFGAGFVGEREGKDEVAGADGESPDEFPGLAPRRWGEVEIRLGDGEAGALGAAPGHPEIAGDESAEPVKAEGGEVGGYPALGKFGDDAVAEESGQAPDAEPGEDGEDQEDDGEGGDAQPAKGEPAPSPTGASRAVRSGRRHGSVRGAGGWPGMGPGARVADSKPGVGDGHGHGVRAVAGCRRGPGRARDRRRRCRRSRR